jgi:hypothetical protein
MLETLRKMSELNRILEETLFEILAHKTEGNPLPSSSIDTSFNS